MRRLLLLTLLFLLPYQSATRANISLPQDTRKAVFLSYSRIGEETYPATNIDKDQFHAHLETIQSGEYSVISLPGLLNAFNDIEPLPEKALVISFDGAYKSAYERGMKLLLEAKIPFTVSLATDQINSEDPQHMGWKELRDIEKTGLVNFALLPANGQRLIDLSEQEALTQINRARMAFREHMKTDTSFFAYPYGEYSLDTRNLLEEQGFKAALALHSGVVYEGSDILALPRFAMTESHGDLDRFTLVANALPLPATNIEPSSPALNTDTPLIGFTLPEELKNTAKTLSCFISGQGRVSYEILGETRVEIRPDSPFPEDRIRINCTMPAFSSENEAQQWRWLGMLLIRPTSNNTLPQDELQ